MGQWVMCGTGAATSSSDESVRERSCLKNDSFFNLTEEQKKGLLIFGSDPDALWNDLAARWSNSRSVFSGR